MKKPRHSQKGGVVIEAILILAGLGLIAKAFIVGTGTYKFMHLAQPAQGIIASIYNYGFTANIQIPQPSGGHIAFVQRGFFQKHAVNDPVEVLYNPSRPTEAHMQKFFALWFDTIMLGLGGFISLVLGFRLRKQRNI